MFVELRGVRLSGSVSVCVSGAVSESESASPSGSGSESASESEASSVFETSNGGFVGSMIPAALSASICGSVRRSKQQM